MPNTLIFYVGYIQDLQVYKLHILMISDKGRTA